VKRKVTASFNVRGGGVCAGAGGDGVESNWKQMRSPKDNESVSAGWCGEPPIVGRSPERRSGWDGGQSDERAHQGVGIGMRGRQGGVSGETFAAG
jgi:hypothetical protein